MFWWSAVCFDVTSVDNLLLCERFQTLTCFVPRVSDRNKPSTPPQAYCYSQDHKCKRSTPFNRMSTLSGSNTAKTHRLKTTSLVIGVNLQEASELTFRNLIMGWVFSTLNKKKNVIIVLCFSSSYNKIFNESGKLCPWRVVLKLVSKIKGKRVKSELICRWLFAVLLLKYCHFHFVSLRLSQLFWYPPKKLCWKKEINDFIWEHD